MAGVESPKPLFVPNPGQKRAVELLTKPQRHTLLFGGARSGKTFLLTRAVVVRALRAAESRHAILRFRGNSVWTSVGMDTLPKVIKTCFPGLVYKTAQQAGYFELPNGSQIWLGGLDDKERVEKILGQEYATVYFNECSQIPYSSVLVARTRLAQVCEGLAQRCYYDMNPTGTGHWTFREFHQKKDLNGKPLGNGDEFAYCTINPDENRANLSAAFLDELQNLPEKQRRRFYEGQYVSEIDGALWTLDQLEQCRVELAAVPTFRRIVVAVDPSGARGPDDKRSDECGIVVAALGEDGLGYVLADLSGRYGPAEWAKIAVTAYHKWGADSLVGEANYGGAMVEHTIRTADPLVKYRAVHASRGKWVRAEPVSALYEKGQDKVRHVGRFPELEDQMCQFSAAGYAGERSPDRADALVWALSELMLTPSRSFTIEELAL